MYGCGNKACTRNLTLQDAKGLPTLDACSASSRMVAGVLSLNMGLRRNWV